MDKGKEFRFKMSTAKTRMIGSHESQMKIEIRGKEIETVSKAT